MFQAIILLLLLLKLNLFSGWFLALWILEVTFQVLDVIVKILYKALDID